jgi:ATP-dependent DNA ligase
MTSVVSPSAARQRPPRFHRALHPDLRVAGSCGPQWVHEIKHDGYRMIARKQAGRLRFIQDKSTQKWTWKVGWAT